MLSIPVALYESSSICTERPQTSVEGLFVQSGKNVLAITLLYCALYLGAPEHPTSELVIVSKSNWVSCSHMTS